MRIYILTALILAALAPAALQAQAQTQAPAQLLDATPASKVQPIINHAASQGKFTFLMFHRTNDVASQTMAQTLSDGIARRADHATWAYVRVTDPAEAALVKQFGLARAPMPLTVAVAPNGAITGMYAQKLDDTSIEKSLVTPTMTQCMKAMQEGKLVVLCGYRSGDAALPKGVQELQADPHFGERMAIVPMQMADPREARFVTELGVAPNYRDTLVVFMAPPGVTVGKYNSLVTKNQMAADLHKAGKCCDNPDCPHHH